MTDFVRAPELTDFEFPWAKGDKKLALDELDNEAGVGSNRAADRCSTMLVLLSGVMVVVTSLHLWRARGDGAIQALRTTLNPNTAPWWELALLPRVGPSLAHRVVEWRESAGGADSQERRFRAFRSVADLDRVPGVGPVTLHRIGPYLHFDDP